MDRKDDKSTTRRVTAQRKFAQGAFVPSVVAAAPAATAATATAAITTAELREAPTTSQDGRNTIFDNNMSASNLLDVVCFANAHSHSQPIVLVERLRGQNPPENNETEPEPPRANVPGRPILKIKRGTGSRNRSVLRKDSFNLSNHAMNLRSRDLVRPPQRLTPPPFKWPVRRNTKRGAPTLPKARVAPKRSRLRTRYLLSTSTSDFSVDDNRPLTYFVRSSTPNGPSPSFRRTAMGPPTRIPQSVVPSIIEAADSEPVGSDSNVAISPSPSIIETSPNPFSDTRIIKVRTITDSNFDELEPGPNDLYRYARPRRDRPCTTAQQVEVNNCSDNLYEANPNCFTRVTRSSETGLSRTQIDLSTRSILDPEERSNQCPSPMSETGESVILVSEEQPNQCPSAAWKTVEAVARAPLRKFESRCTHCPQCQRIEKVIKLSELLKRQNSIEFSNNLNPVINSSSQPQSDRSLEEDDSQNEYFYIDLLPRHPHIMIKLKIRKSQGRTIYGGCLIPRSDAKPCAKFILEAQSHIIDAVTETVPTLLEDPQPNSDQVPGPSGTQSKPDQDTDSQQASTSRAKMLGTKTIQDAPIFYPSPKEFTLDALTYFLKIWDRVSNYGICKIVPPPDFKPTSNSEDNLRFTVSNQYISRLFTRWGNAARDICIIKACLRRQKIAYSRAPQLLGVELNLPKLVRKVQLHGGLESVLNKKRWMRVAMDMQYPLNPFVARKLDLIYVKYILPFDALTKTERSDLKERVMTAWNKKEQKLRERARNPLHRQKQLLGESDTSSDDGEDDDYDEADEMEDCVKLGSTMNLYKFKKIAKTFFNTVFYSQAPKPEQIEDEYWKTVMQTGEHVSVLGASIDTGSEGYGFTKNKEDPYSKHSWNLKVIGESPKNVLHSLGPVVGVTVPTLHLGMLFTTSCWQRDPHDLACVDYNHFGSSKIWYGIPGREEEKFRTAAESLCPMLCQNKSLWLPSDIAMIPPKMLVDHVDLYRVEQKPGEFVVVMPRAYSCSFNTGYAISESTYFAINTWVDTLGKVFKKIRKSCEPTMFSLEQLLKSIAEDPSTGIKMLLRIQPLLEMAYGQEMMYRKRLESRNIPLTSPAEEPEPSTSKGKKAKPQDAPPPKTWNVRELDECEICRSPLYLSKVRHLPTKNAVLCVEHAVRLLDHVKYANVDISKLQLIYEVSTEKLKETIDNLQTRIISDEGESEAEDGGNSEDKFTTDDWDIELNEKDFEDDLQSRID